MAKDLYELCEICDGTGALNPEKQLTWNPRSAVEKYRRPDGTVQCPCCSGTGFIPIGLTVGQVERMRAELDRLKAGAAVR